MGHARPVGREVAAVHVLQLGQLAGLGADGGDLRVAFTGTGFGRDDAGDAAEDGGLFERRRDEIGVALGLFHFDADLERAVDLAVLHQVAADDAAGFEVVGVRVGVVVAVPLWVVEIRCVGVLREVELDDAEDHPAFGAFVVLLRHFEVDLVLLQLLRLVDGQADAEGFDVVPGCFVFADHCLFGAASMLGRDGGREMPFH